MSSRLVLVRHGETEWSRVGRHTGRTDLPLTPAGEGEAREIGDTLRGWAFASVFSSPLRRARDTARLAGFEGTLDDDLMEWDYGAVEGLTNGAVTAEQPGWSKWFDTVPDGEQVADVAARADRFIRRTADLADDVLVFGHGHHLAITVARWLDLDPVEGRRFPLETATVSVLGHKRGERVVETVNRPCGPPLTKG
jgi:broad specificity phosphatase PhoE